MQRVDNTREPLGKGKAVKNGEMSLVVWDSLCSTYDGAMQLSYSYQWKYKWLAILEKQFCYLLLRKMSNISLYIAKIIYSAWESTKSLSHLHGQHYITARIKNKVIDGNINDNVTVLLAMSNIN